jgi:citrate synthase
MLNLNDIEAVPDHSEMIARMSAQARHADEINNGLYERYNVKRGLRNADGSGVLVGLTSIGEVRGYIIVENEKAPIEGRLLYRGIDIDRLVEGCKKDHRFGFEECCYLLLCGKLPTKSELESFKEMLDDNRRLPNGFAEDMIMKAPSPDIMNKLARCVLASYSYDDDPDDTDTENVMRQCIRLIGQFPTMTAYAYQAKSHYYDGKSLYIHNPQRGLSTSENLLQMIRPDSKYTQLEAEILDLCLMIHAEHGGGNNSTFAVHVVTSTGTDTYSSIAAAVGSLKGPKHGGANLRVMNMIEDIKAHVNNIDDDGELKDYLAKLLRGEAYDRSGLVYGIGHAVYTLSDPRANLLKNKARELVEISGPEFQREFRLLERIEEFTPDLFAEIKHSDKHLCANVDFYSGLVYSMLNIPKTLFTPIFAISRISGWCAHRIEELAITNRIIRPAYKNVGKKQQYEDLSERV